MTLLEFRTCHTECADLRVVTIELGRSGDHQLRVGQGASYLPPALKHVVGALRLPHVSREDRLSRRLRLGGVRLIVAGVERVQRIVDAPDSAIPRMMQQRNPAEIRYRHYALDPSAVQQVGDLGWDIDV